MISGVDGGDMGGWEISPLKSHKGVIYFQVKLDRLNIGIWPKAHNGNDTMI